MTFMRFLRCFAAFFESIQEAQGTLTARAVQVAAQEAYCVRLRLAFRHVLSSRYRDRSLDPPARRTAPRRRADRMDARPRQRCAALVPRGPFVRPRRPTLLRRHSARP